jgi:hypothetical protein
MSKAPDDFHRQANTRDGLQTWCKACKKQFVYEWRARDVERTRRSVYKSNLWRNYRLTLEQYEAMFLDQGGRCAICEQPESVRNRDGSLRRLHVDHDHQSGTVRALLCSACNHVVGYIERSPDRIGAVSQYLRSWGVLA